MKEPYHLWPRCGLGSQDPEGTQPGVLPGGPALQRAGAQGSPLPEQVELVKGMLGATEQGHVLS